MNNKKKSYKNQAENIKLPQGWLLLGKEAYTVEDIKNILDADTYDIEIWIEAGILEIGIDEKNSMDIETLKTSFGDEFTDSFLAENEIQSVFYISFRPEVYPECRQIMKHMVGTLNCIICADSQDLMPQIS